MSRKNEGLTAAWDPENTEIGSDECGGLESPEPAEAAPPPLTEAAAAAAKSIQLCPTLCDSIDGSPPGSAVPGILQAKTLEWVAISFSNAWKWKVKVKSLSRARLLATPWTAAHQAPLSIGFSRQEYWSGVQFLVTDNSVFHCRLCCCSSLKQSINSDLTERLFLHTSSY